MLSFLPTVGCLAIALFFYFAGFMLVGYFSQAALREFKFSSVRLLEQQLSLEIRDHISTFLVSSLEAGQTPTLFDLAEVCPDVFSSGEAWKIWIQESAQMLQTIYGSSAPHSEPPYCHRLRRVD